MAGIGLQPLVLGATLVLIDGTVGLAVGRIGQLLRKPRLARTLSSGRGAIVIGLAGGSDCAPVMRQW
jgi:threonine/homoserine/homoserine lactone efflux protein